MFVLIQFVFSVFPDCWHEIQDFCRFAKSAINQFHFIKKKNKYKVDATENTAIGLIEKGLVDSQMPWNRILFF